MTVNLFCGHEPAEAIGFHVFVDSVMRNATVDVAFHPLDARGLPKGTNSFTTSRFLVPWLMGGHRQFAIFADASDMLMLGDIADLAGLFDPRYAVQVVKHPNYATRHPRKYVGTGIESPNRDYERKNWASVMLFNCLHPAWDQVTPEFVRETPVIDLLQLRFLDDELIGELPPEWNVLVDEGQPVGLIAQLLHWTAGIPAFAHYADAPAANHWRAARAALESGA